MADVRWYVLALTHALASLAIISHSNLTEKIWEQSKNTPVILRLNL